MFLLSTRLKTAARIRNGYSKCLFSSSTPFRIELAYQLIEPPTQEKKRNGQPIVFMHGFMGNKLNNRSISKALARDLNRDIYIVDLRNHGDSPHVPEHTYTHLANDVSDFIKLHRLRKTVLIGHSMGAKAAMVLALQSPETVTGLIPVDNAPVSAMLGSPFNDYVKGMKEISEARVTRQSEADQILAKYEPSLAIRQFLLTNLIRDPETDNKTLKFRVPIDTLGSNLDEMADFPWKFDRENDSNNADLPTYNGPTLIVRGLQSKYVSDKRLPAVKRFFPNAQIVGIDAGHWVISEKPEEFRQAVVKFFRENDIE
ncbi:proline iminopeptidase, putative [Talaromyces stipitatus ATCC 10500]|uniref:Proline iminopeptidase, putative n=1 Tax=Talaromyces stipitatus (strain ATCC 10500 / CBS 375.48 / QM 6759 / NRRL 1006) TaxID=441959 RepID=B8MJF0_TALSN|nr:proline iminopeptidase, putative [Talaromyces stipitatus ATCC 10500]EED15150.1 proline iminopeptidase, putative [Talaromyces stipitatus ATCC 10500]